MVSANAHQHMVGINGHHVRYYLKGEIRMTFCKVLARGKNGEDDVTAYECKDFEAVMPYYEIVVSRDGIARLVEHTARTTWKRRFQSMIE